MVSRQPLSMFVMGNNDFFIKKLEATEWAETKVDGRLKFVFYEQPSQVPNNRYRNKKGNIGIEGSRFSPHQLATYLQTLPQCLQNAAEVLMHDPSRGMSIKITANKIYWSQQPGKWNLLQSGVWRTGMHTIVLIA